MTTSEEKRGPSRATVVALVIVAAALAFLPALRGHGTAEAHNAVAADCGDGHGAQACQD